MMAIRKFALVALRRAGDQAQRADGDDRRSARPALPAPSLSGRGGGVDGWRHLLHLRDAGRRPRAGEVRARGRAARGARRGARRRSSRRSWRCRASCSAKIPPRPSGYGNTRELFPRYTGQMFDAITPAVVASDMTVGYLLSDTRAARLVEQHALDPALPGPRHRHRSTAVVDVRRHEREPVRSRDRARRSARRRRTPDDARLDRRHAAGTGDREPEAAAARAAAGGRAIDQRRRVGARGAARVGHQAIPRSAVHAGEPHRCPDRASRRADRRSRNGLAGTAGAVLRLGVDAGSRL